MRQALPLNRSLICTAQYSNNYRQGGQIVSIECERLDGILTSPALKQDPAVAFSCKPGLMIDVIIELSIFLPVKASFSLAYQKGTMAGLAMLASVRDGPNAD